LLINCLLGSQLEEAFGVRDLKLRNTIHGLNILEGSDSPESFTGTFGKKDVADGLLILISEVWRQELLLEELSAELGGFGLEGLVLLGGRLRVVASNFWEDKRG